MLAGFWIATAGFNIYGVFDYITFTETLENYSDVDIDVKKFDFALKKDAKLAMVMVMASFVLVFIAYFTVHALLQGCSAKPSQGHLYTSRSSRNT